MRLGSGQRRSILRCRILLVALFGIVILPAPARTQDSAAGERETPKSCSHRDGISLWDSMRVLPVRIVDINGDTVRWKYQDVRTVKLGWFFLHENAKFISNGEKEVKVSYVMQRKESEWFCFYCYRCYTLLRAYEFRLDLPR
jgi:hypothetical protein